MHYNPSVELAFVSVEHKTNENSTSNTNNKSKFTTSIWNQNKNDLSDIEFKEWLSGFIDGEGWFNVYIGKNDKKVDLIPLRG